MLGVVGGQWLVAEVGEEGRGGWKGEGREEGGEKDGRGERR